ncbi:Hypothetical predicted protein, partial [Mytilus galloprovincialis]
IACEAEEGMLVEVYSKCENEFVKMSAIDSSMYIQCIKMQVEQTNKKIVFGYGHTVRMLSPLLIGKRENQTMTKATNIALRRRSSTGMHGMIDNVTIQCDLSVKKNTGIYFTLVTDENDERSGIEKMLEDLHLMHTIANFQEDKNDIDTVLSLSEQQIIRLGWKSLPMFVYLLRSSQTASTLKYIAQILKPKFLAEGSNNRRFEDSVYTAYLKYLRAVTSGRREFISLQNVLQFDTGSKEEPVLGFTLNPFIDFVEVKQGSSFLPTANTCINTMQLPRPSLLIDLPPT